MKQKILFLDRDGVLLVEPGGNTQIDCFSKLKFLPNMFYYLRKIATELDYKLVMITNQDGLGKEIFTQESFDGPHNFLMECLENEKIFFSEVHIDKTFPEENAPTRKPGTGLLTHFMNTPTIDMENSFMIGDRYTDMMLAHNLDCKGIWIYNFLHGFNNLPEKMQADIAIKVNDWEEIYNFLKIPQRISIVTRNTNETQINIKLNLDGTGISKIETKIPFFNHMLEQIAKHGNFDIDLNCDGDIEIDEHHTIEDTALALGDAFKQALGNKKGIERYAFVLPMDDCLAQVALDFGGRPWLVWDAKFKREKIGEMPTEMFLHFFKSFTDTAACNLNIIATGDNEHHKIESIFKAFAKTLMQAAKRNNSNKIPSTKGIL